MKTLSVNFLCCSWKLYKIGLLIAFVYLIPNLIVIALIFGNGFNNYSVASICALTVYTSLLLIKGLIEERHRLLLPWLANIAVLILFNVILFYVQFEEMNREESKRSFYLLFGSFVALEIQIIFWCTIYCLLMKGYQKSRALKGRLESISKMVDNQKNDYFKVNLMANEHLIGDKTVNV